jgi:hypothetical protein
MPSITEYWKPLAEDVSALAFFSCPFCIKKVENTLVTRSFAANEVLNSPVMTVYLSKHADGSIRWN